MKTKNLIPVPMSRDGPPKAGLQVWMIFVALCVGGFFAWPLYGQGQGGGGHIGSGYVAGAHVGGYVGAGHVGGGYIAGGHAGNIGGSYVVTGHSIVGLSGEGHVGGVSHVGGAAHFNGSQYGVGDPAGYVFAHASGNVHSSYAGYSRGLGHSYPPPYYPIHPFGFHGDFFYDFHHGHHY